MTTFHGNIARSATVDELGAGESAVPIWSNRLGWCTLFGITLAVIAMTWSLRFSIAASTPWQCDEIPLLVRFTGLCGHVTNEQEAQVFTPSYYTAYMGALRSLKAPKFFATLHTTTGFWTNLTVHLFGVSPLGGRAGSLLWSFIAIIAVGWGGFLVSRSWVTSCVAMCVIGLSPHAIAYGAQVRGYAESMALAPLLLVSMELLRRRPDRWLRAIAVLTIALLLSLTLYTSWVFWTLPTLLIGLGLHRTIHDSQGRRAARTVFTLLAVGLIAFMTLFTIDRWSHLTQQASIMGTSVHGLGGAWRFIVSCGVHLFFEPISVVVFAAIGAAVVWRTKLRWWVLAIAAGVVIPTIFAMANGSAGFARTFGYLIGPTAILFGVAFDSLWRELAYRFSSRAVAVAMLSLLLGASGWAYAGAENGARGILLPDWGKVATWIDREPETVGPQWLCHDLANHWQIEWYRTRKDYGVFMDVETGGTIEVLMGAQYDEQGRATVFRHDPVKLTMPQDPLPAFLTAVEPERVQSGIELRRWIGRRWGGGDTLYLEPVAPMFLLFRDHQAISTDALGKFLIETQARLRGLVSFKVVRGRKGLIRSLIAPFEMVSDINTAMRDVLGIDPADMRWFELQPWTNPRRSEVELGQNASETASDR